MRKSIKFNLIKNECNSKINADIKDINLMKNIMTPTSLYSQDKKIEYQKKIDYE